jgi:hypothetical protein
LLALLALTALTAPACAPRTATSELPAPAAGAPPVRSLMHGLWIGTAEKSPLGRQPYAIAFRSEGAEIVGETPPTLGAEILPPGAYQKFRFTQNGLGYKTAMGERGVLDGELELDETRSSAARAIFCEPSKCDSMELRWESVDAERMSLQVWLDGRLHADIALSFEGDP